MAERGALRLHCVRDLVRRVYCLAQLRYLHRDNLLKTVPDEVGHLKSLSNLDLHSNQLTEFPAKACSLRLSLLDLSNNLSGLPFELGAMTSLRKLLLGGNPMRSLRRSQGAGPSNRKCFRHLRAT